ncbi:MAG: biotin--[acetyl-CoA-carboxylase] ligase [Chitinophagaceae bacterium]|nr:MAG: biotin--[acetyl-CoA-carboxylase] ligase [Chitinophagaceae bacterium]
MAQAHAGLATHGTAYFALEQTAGKGQRGKSWLSAPGENIMMSLNLSPRAVRIDQAFLLSAAVALGCYDFYKSIAGDETAIKWPNDIYWRDRKAGGILIENQLGAPDNSWNCSIAGIGLNVNQTVFEQQQAKAVSLKQITGKAFDVFTLAKELCVYISKRMELLYTSRFKQLIDDYNQALYLRGHSTKLRSGPVVFTTEIAGVDPGGWLLTRDAVDRRFAVGEVEWLTNQPET